MVVTLIGCSIIEVEAIENALSKRTGIHIYEASQPDEISSDIAFISLTNENSKKNAVKLRKIAPATDIILISQKPSDVQFAFDLPANQFIWEKGGIEDILKVFDWVVVDQIYYRKKWFIKNKTGSYFLMSNDIYYIETRNERLTFHTLNGIVDCKGSMVSAIRHFEGYGFFCSHKSYLVNAKYVKTFHYNTVVLENGNILPISRSRRSNFLSGIKEYQDQIKNYKR